MVYFSVVQSLESLYHLDENIPYLVFLYVGVFFLIIRNFLIEVAVISILHNDTFYLLYHKELVPSVRNTSL